MKFSPTFPLASEGAMHWLWPRLVPQPWQPILQKLGDGGPYIYNNIISISWLYTEALIPGIAPWNMFPQNMVGPNFPQPTGGRPRIPSTPRILGITRPGKR
jgi:hypothetical protein